MKNKSVSGYLNLASAIIGVIVTIYAGVFTMNAGIFDGAFVAVMVIAILCQVVYLFNAISLLPIIAVALYASGLMLFLRLSISSLVGFFTGVAMFGGTSDATSLFVIMGIILMTGILEIVSSFFND